MNKRSIKNMIVNGVFKRFGWKPLSKADYRKFLIIEEKLKKSLKGYYLKVDKHPIVEK